MKAKDKWLLKVTKPVWVDLCEADCNPDIIPLSLCDAAEIGFNKGFSAALTVVIVAGGSILAGGWIADKFSKK